MEKLKVLVVDGSPAAHGALQTYLSDRGMEVLTIQSGIDAIASAATHQPHVVILNLDHLSVHALEVASLLRERTDTRHIPLVGTTRSERTVDAARVTGFQAVFIEPFDRDSLFSQLRRLSMVSAARRVNGQSPPRSLIVETLQPREDQPPSSPAPSALSAVQVNPTVRRA